MSQQQAAHPGAPEPATAAPHAATPDLQQVQDAPRGRTSPPAARKARGFAAAFGSGSGAAWVLRDLASI